MTTRSPASVRAKRMPASVRAKRSPILPAMVAAAMMASTPAGAWWIGPCSRSFHEDVTTLHSADIYKDCFPYCLISIEPTHNAMRSSIIDYKKEGYTGPVDVAVISNDSRLGPGMIGGPTRLGALPAPDGLTNWNVRFHGLEPAHYYAMVIYGSGGPANPFFRSCFLSNEDPDPQPDDDLLSNPISEGNTVSTTQ